MYTRPDQHPVIRRWCDWCDAVLASPGPSVLVHGDLHGNNQVWDDGKLRLVVDLETAGVAEPEYDLRLIPGPDMGPGVELLTARTAPPCSMASRPGLATRPWLLPGA